MENDKSPDNTVGGTSEASGPAEDVAQNQPAAKSDKIDILLKATGDAPILKRKKWSVPGDRKISSIIDFLKKYLKCEPHESLFLYVQQTFAPSPDQDIRNLYECYGSDGKLVLHYCKSEAWG
ncbi:Ubiquitin-like protein ATG12 [Holothuria leucospilota]|uniref:Ubiquitin-like protein ATG12 n=1 Tax=Holothuria leucospilota TaxID=206669 RepID=A0A9Q1H6X8_HOLLE|nr:Ubiquitin-like protein ATG12 [Holothuria leucospilota]